MYWEKYAHHTIKEKVTKALRQNLDYRDRDVLGLPATFLDPKVFYSDAPFLKDAPYMQTMVANPNHIGCHTLTEAEPAFSGTHAIERDLIKICACEIFKSKEGEYDGYVASGGTEANIEAMWILRNYFRKERGAKPGEIALVYSQDSHYSMPKGANLLSLHSIVVPVAEETRQIQPEALKEAVQEAKEEGFKYFILVMNMSTTMFGSVDDIGTATSCLDALEVEYRVHVDGAYGGFIYPFACKEEHPYTFENPKIVSFSLDAHKLVQSPYGTGIFLARKGMIEYALTEEAQYVKGKDYTLVGSRSGANAVAVWMILRTYGSEGWVAKTADLIERTDRLCMSLDERSIPYYRHPKMNIVAIKGSAVPQEIVQQFMLVPDTHEGKPSWVKIVVMEHVTQGKLDKFLFALDGVSR
ncbi:pyridoxal phosphate-dependent decarboxylase family protein [Nafulsella turpanensis]|uniref:pyridoxal phosphate-dependent decarboxylase family protein n=1 Tax=Nafulsella turpanensis TaxID=1265690 RepID=UPI00034DC3A9|nr:pyridoxal-dependent decarboxylase [Nafulsella turpanensis]